MYFFKLILIAAITTFFLLSCGEKVDELKKAAEMVQKAPEMAKNMEQSANEAQAIREQRVKRGDTLAMHYEKLQTYLPASIPGYEAEEPSGETMNYMGFSYSTASRRYVQKGGDISKEIEVQIIDYVAVESLYLAATYWLSGFSRENAESYDKTFDPGIKNVFALDHFEKKDKRGEVTYGVGYRFLIKITGNHIDNTDILKNVAKSMKLEELAKM
ncbi:MAG: hypothetical protein N2319_10235 [Candidatus Kapabacteria bacterium]|nr:hypothetical protein [Candidatus Kapabacteria bacterium]